MVPSIISFFKEIIIYENQTIAFSDVDAHHQSGISERMIKTVTYHTRSMFLNAMICWTDVTITELWTYGHRTDDSWGNKNRNKGKAVQ